MIRLIPILLLVSAATATATEIAILNVNVITMTDARVVAGQTVLIDDGLITSIGDVDATPIPEDIVVVDGTDRFVMPGLAEMHAHVPTQQRSIERVLTLFAANGVTTIRGMLGAPVHLPLRDHLKNSAVFGPRLITSGPSMNGNSVTSPAHGAAGVRAQFEAGYDFIKIHPGLTTAEFDAIATTAHELGMPFAGHVPVAVGLDGVLTHRMATIDHLDGYFAALMPADRDSTGGFGGFFDVLVADQIEVDRMSEVAAATASAGVWNVPTESLIEHRLTESSVDDLLSRPEMRYIDPQTLAQWQRSTEQVRSDSAYDQAVLRQAVKLRRALILALHEAGAGLLLGSDAPQVFNVPGFSIHDELEDLVGAGLTPYDAIATGTTAVAEFLDLNTGAVAVGRDADLVLLDANPLDDIRNTRRIHGVVLRGVWYSRTDIDSRLEGLAH
ncbi:MAG: amidohydrolase family protein [Pseudomonadota bacterium]